MTTDLGQRLPTWPLSERRGCGARGGDKEEDKGMKRWLGGGGSEGPGEGL